MGGEFVRGELSGGKMSGEEFTGHRNSSHFYFPVFNLSHSSLTGFSFKCCEKIAHNLNVKRSRTCYTSTLSINVGCKVQLMVDPCVTDSDIF